MIGELQVPHWQWWIVLYFFAGGIAGGAYILSMIIELVGAPEDRPVARMGYYIAFPLSLLCAVLLIVDLGRPERFWHMVIYSKTFLPWVKLNSPISVGAYALLFFGGFSFLSFVDALVETGKLPWAPLRAKYSGLPRKLYACVGAFFGFFLMAYTGELLATSYLPLWGSSAWLGALFTASGASSGIAAVVLGLMITSAQVGPVWDKIKQADNVAMILELLLLAVFLVSLGAAAGPLMKGLSATLLFGGVFFVGLLVPLALQLPAELSRRVGIKSLAALLILLGGFLVRTTIVLGGQGLL